MDELNIPKEYYMADIICKKCKKANPPQAKFCGGCGGPMDAKAPVIADADIEALFESSFTEAQQSDAEGFAPETTDLFKTNDGAVKNTEDLEKIFDSSSDDRTIESIFDDYVPDAESHQAAAVTNSNDKNVVAKTAVISVLFVLKFRAQKTFKK